MSLKQLYARHQELWFCLADNPKMPKSDWPGWKKYGAVPSDCFPCGYMYQSHKDCGCGGKHCSLDWPGGACTLPGDIGLHDEWRLARNKNRNHRVVMADLIANVPLKKGLK